VSPSRGDRGVATMLTVGVLALLLMTAATGVGVVQVVAARHAAGGAADLGALAGASEQRHADRCAAAVVVVRANDAEPVSCRATGDAVLVTAAVRTEALLGLRWTLRASARAGPVR